MAETPQDGKQPRILLVDDEKNLVFMLSKILRRHGYDVTAAHDGEEGWRVLSDAMGDPDLPEDAEQPIPFDAVMTDLQMPKMDGMALLKKIRESYPELPTIVLTGHGSIQTAVEAMKIGAMDYLIKPANPDEILIVLKKALELQNLRVENRVLKSRLGRRADNSLEIIGRSPAIQGVLNMVRAVSRNRSTVSIIGESGTGKELVARAIHDSGPHARYPFIAVNCGALSESLLESQLFGHKRGAFTGAINDHVGFFEAADGGTLFLDEISEMSPHLQVKLLRAIQEREVIPVGGTQPHRINLRLVCATNRDLEYEVRRGNFRQDLFYRLNVVTIHLAPLRERQSDVPDLVGHFILRFAKEYDVAPKSVQPDAMAVLANYSWPGNIRELENVIERCFALSARETISLEDLPHQLARSPEEALAAMTPQDPERGSGDSLKRGEGGLPLLGKAPRTPEPIFTAPPVGTAPPPPTVPQPAAGGPITFSEPYTPKPAEDPLTLDEMEKRQIVEALRRARGKKVDAAKILGIDRKRLYRKMKKYELD